MLDPFATLPSLKIANWTKYAVAERRKLKRLSSAQDDDGLVLRKSDDPHRIVSYVADALLNVSEPVVTPTRPP